MPSIIFYEKPGCLTNRKQKTLLQDAGFSLEVRDLLSEPWSAAELTGFLQPLPVSEWFNPAAPQVKKGEVDPQILDEAAAIKLLLAKPLLIRRPLMEWQQKRLAGFDPLRLKNELGIVLIAGQDKTGQALQECSRVSKTGGSL